MAAYTTNFHSFCVILSTLLTFFCLLSSSSALKNTSTEFIRSKCNSTDYPRLCITSLSSYASAIQNDPVHLAHAALNVSLSSVQSASAVMARLSSGGSGRSGMSSRESEAVSDCMEVLKDSVSYLRQSLQEMGKMEGSDVGEKISDVQTWVSTALTDESTCMDGFGGEEGEGGSASSPRNKVGGLKSMVIRGEVVRVAQLTSNALALVSGLAPTESVSP